MDATRWVDGGEGASRNEGSRAEQTISGGLLAALRPTPESASPVDRFLAGELSVNDIATLNGEDVHSIATAGYQRYESGRYRDALAIFEALAIANPYDAYFQSMLGALYQVLGDRDAALAHYDRSVDLHPDVIHTRVARGELFLRQGRIERAIEDFRVAVDLGESAVLDPEESQLVGRARTILTGTAQTLRALQEAAVSSRDGGRAAR